MTRPDKISVGEVDRLSNSGNAMIDAESISRLDGKESQLDKEVNLGQLPEEIVGEEVRFVHRQGWVGLCLDPQYIDENYLRGMSEYLGGSSFKIEPSEVRTDVDITDVVTLGDIVLSDNLVSNPDDGLRIDIPDNRFLTDDNRFITDVVTLGDILLADNLVSNPDDGLRIDIPDNRFLAKVGPKTGDEWNCLGVVEGPIIQNEVPVPVEVTKVHPTYVETKGAFPEIEDELPNIGETVTATTGPQTGMGTLAIYETDYDAVPVLLEDTQYPSGESLKIQINSIEGTHAIGEAVFSAGDFDVIQISDDELPHRERQSRNRIISQGAPIDIEPVPEDAITTNRVVITDEDTDALVGRWNIREEIDPVDIGKGNEVELDIQSVDGDSCVGYYKQVPVRVDFNTAVPAEFEGERLSVSIQLVHPDKAIAEPTWISGAQGVFEVRIVRTTANDAIAIREGHLVRIPNSSVVSSGDRVLVGLSDSTGNDVPTATVSARPVFQNTDGPLLIRLPHIRGDAVTAGGTPTVVDHLPNVDTAVTLGVDEVKDDHIVPTVTALPEAHRPDEGDFEVRIVRTTANDAIAIREGYLVRIPNSSVVSSGDRVLVGLSDSTGNDVPTATVSARPVFQNTDGPLLIRLPHIRGDAVTAGGTPAVVDHLPNVDTAVTLGVDEVKEDHIVPTVTALPETHLPNEGDFISAKLEETVDNMAVGVGEELPLRLPLFLPTEDDTTTARVLERRSESLLGVVGWVGGDTGSLLQQVYDHLQSADLALQQERYRDATEHLNESLQACPSELPVFERLLAVQEMMIQAILTIRDNAEFGQTAHMLSEETNRLREFEDDGWSTGEVRALLSAREAEMRAAERLLTALDEMDHDNTSNLQAIAQGVSAKPPAVKAAEHLRTAEEFVAKSPFREQIPSLWVRAVIREFKDAFPSIIDELRPFEPPEDDAEWLRYFRPEWMVERTDATLPNTETGGDTWQRPAVPERMGVVSIMDDVGDVDTPMELSTTTQSTSELENDSQSKESDFSDIGTTESRQTEINGVKESATDEETPATEHGQTSVVPEERGSEQVATAEASSDESKAETTTDEQTSATGDTSENKTEAAPTVETTLSTTENKTGESETSDEPLSVPDDSHKLRELRNKAEAEASDNPEREHVETTTSRYQRSSAVREYALARADGTCELCGEVAPFVKENGEPFLEVHHVDELGEGGADHPSLVGAVCPNCHKEIHYGKRGDNLNEQLRRRLENGLGDVGAVDE